MTLRWLLKTSWDLSKIYRKRQIFIIILWIGIILSSALYALLYRDLIDYLVQFKIGRELLFFGIFLILISIFMNLLNFYAEYYITLLQNLSVGDLWKTLFGISLRSKYRDIAKGKVSKDMAKILSDTQLVGIVIGSAIPGLVVNIFRIVGYSIVLAYLSVHFSMIVYLSGVLYFFVYWRFSPRIIETSQKEREEFENVFDDLREKIQGVLSIKKTGKENHFSQLFLFKVSSWYEAIKSLLWNEKKYYFSFSAITMFMPIFVLVVGSYLIWSSKLTLTIGTLLAFVDMSSSIYEPLSNIAQTLGGLSRAIPPTKRVVGILKKTEEKEIGKRELKEFENLKYEKVVLTHEKNKFELHVNDLTILKSEKIGVVGASGSGKSTFAFSMIGFIDPDTGRILLNELPIDVYSKKELISKIALISSDEMLFTGSVKDNILLGDKNLENNLQKIMKICQIDDISLNSTITSGGGNISLGQRQRIAIARALIREPDVIILDEALSGVDSEREEKIISKIIEFFPGITIVLISHRLSSIKLMDKIIFIDNYKITSKKTFDELLQDNRFTELVKNQLET